MTKMNKIFLIIGLFALLIPSSYSDGGCIKIADDILIQLSSAPHVPIAGKQVSYLFSFGDNQANLINKEINGTLKIVKNDETVFIKIFKIKDGILELKHTYKEPGSYEIYFDFQVGNKNYKPEDFLIEAIGQKNDFANKAIFLIIGVIIGIVIAKFRTKKSKFKKKK